MKKILSLLLAVCMLLGLMCGCGNGGSNGNVLTDEQQIQQVVTDYVTTICSFDFEKALGLVVKDTELYSSVENMSSSYSMDSLMDAMFSGLDIPTEYKEQMSTVMKDWFTKTMSDCKVETTNIIVEGDIATADVKVSTPDITKVGDVLSNYENYVTEEQLSELMQKYALSFNENTQWEMVLEILPVVLESASDDIEYTNYSTKISLDKIDNRWLVSADEQ